MEDDSAPEKVEASGPLPRGQERVLVVDDEPMLAEMVMQMLEELGYDVVSRTSGIEALEAFRHRSSGKRFDLVITDMTMPHFTGIDLAREISRRDPAVPVILMTGFSKKIDAERAEEIGIQGFLMKPVAMEQLATTVRMVLDRRTNE
jgi:CheY-like chemotaxis protein